MPTARPHLVAKLLRAPRCSCSCARALYTRADDDMTSVAVTGTAKCGKTMFLTSLLWHLEAPDESRFQLRDGITIRRFQPLPVPKGQRTFKFKKYRSQMAHDFTWPSKTLDVSHFRCSFKFKRSDWWSIWGAQHVDFLDLPGERVADAAMALHADYAVWSDHVLDHLDDDSVGREVAAEYRRLFAVDTVDAATVVRGYRRLLARVIRAFKPFVSPSVFLVDTQGNCAPDETVEELVENRRCGLDEEREFAPLPADARDRWPDVAARMARHYGEYRTTVVLPVFRDLMSAHSLVIMVDVPTILLAGPRRLVDERQVILDLVGSVSNHGFYAALRRFLGLGSSLSRVAFVATKADLVAPDDLRNGRLASLLRSMNAQARQLLPSSVAVKWFAASSCHSSTPGARPYTLVGQTEPGPFVSERHAEEFSVSPLPEAWPATWSEGDYRYPSFWPRLPEALMWPPRHRSLDSVFEFIVLG